MDLGWSKTFRRRACADGTEPVNIAKSYRAAARPLDHVPVTATIEL
jgi:hypothetical protein